MFNPKSFIYLGEGVTLAKSWQEDYDYVNAHLRDMDRRETEVFDGGKPDRLSDMERSWTIRDGENIVGYFATMTFPDESILSRRRFLVELTTDYVWKIKVKYVRFSRRVVRAVVENTAPWATDFYTLPMADYGGTVKWQQKILGFRKINEIDVEGVKHVLLHTTRQEVLKW